MRGVGDVTMSGIINTPSIVEYAPIYGAVYLAGWAMSHLKNVSNDVKELKNFKEATVNEIHNIKNNCIKNHTS